MLPWYVAAIIGAGALVAGVALGYLVRKASAEAKLGSAEMQAKRMLDDAMKNAESVRKESVLSAKEEIFQMKKEADFDIKERRKEVSRLERRIAQKEETLDAKLEGIEKKEAHLAEKFQEAEQLKTEVGETLKKQVENLEKIAGLTSEEAKAELVARLDSEMRHETALKIAEYDARFREEADAKAKDILSGVARVTASTVLSEEGGCCRLALETSGMVDNALCREIFFAFAKENIAILEMKSTKVTLEDIFIELTGKGEKK